jgi:hypothetical protein
VVEGVEVRVVDEDVPKASENVIDEVVVEDDEEGGGGGVVWKVEPDPTLSFG